MFTTLLLGLIALVSSATEAAGGCGRIVCYHTNWSQYRPGNGKFFPDNIDPSLCTHIIYAFAKIQGNDLAAFEWNDDDTAWSVGLYSKFGALKQRNPSLKTLLAVGGWNMGSSDFSRIVQSASSRNHFITQAISFLRARHFDGLDIDWEYPANRGSPPEDRNHYTEFLRELRQEINSESQRTGQAPLILTAAVAAGKPNIDTAYDVPAVSAELDFINLMSYDLHGSWETVTGHNSPLYARSEETGDDRYLNVDFAARYWVEKGAPKEKINIGMGLYGRSFTLASSSDHAVGSAAPRGGAAGTFTRESGFLSYYEICDMKASGGQEMFIDEQRVPYMYYRDQWVGYDSPASLREKVRYVKEHNYGGVMVWALPLDDFTGQHCGQGPFPLLHAINDECLHTTGNLHTPSPVQTTLYPPVTTTLAPGGTYPATHQPPIMHGDLFDCQQHADGFYPSTRSCSEYFICAGGTTYTVQCAEGFTFNTVTRYCDWPERSHCNVAGASTTGPHTDVVNTVDMFTTHGAGNTHHVTTAASQMVTTAMDITSFCNHKTDGIHADPTDPSNFIECSNGYAYQMRCAPGSMFNEDKLTCESNRDYVNNHPTTATPAPTTTSTPRPTTTTPRPATTREPTHVIAYLDLMTFCNGLSDGIHADPTNPYYYIECSTGIAYHMRCAPGNIFNETILTCETDHGHQTHQPIIAQPVTTTPVPTTTPEPTVPTTAYHTRSPGDVDLNAYCLHLTDGVHPDPTHCGFFVECSNGYGYRVSCAPGSVFNDVINSCDNPHNVPHCNNDPTTDKPAGLDSFCATQTDGVHPNPQECASYIECSNGLTYILKCSPGTAFNPEMLACDRLENVPSCDHQVYATTP